MRRSVVAPSGPTSGNSRLASDAPEVTDRRESESAPKAMGSTRVETDRGAATEGMRHSNFEGRSRNGHAARRNWDVRKRPIDRKSVVWGTSVSVRVDRGGGGTIK